MSITISYKRFKFFPILILLCMVSSIAISQSLDPYYVARIGTKGQDKFDGISLDSLGNYYIYASFALDTVMLGDTTLILPDSNRNFIVKYNANNKLQWVKSTTNFHIDGSIPERLRTSYQFVFEKYDTAKKGPLENSIRWSDTVIVFKHPVTQYELISKRDTNGKTKWVVPVYNNDSNSRYGYRVLWTNGENTYICGLLKGSAFIDTTLIVGNPDAYVSCVAKLDNFGKLQWVRIDDIAQSTPKSLQRPEVEFVVTGPDDIFIIGNYFDNITFGDTTLFNLDSSKNQYLAKIDSNGKPQFIHKMIERGSRREFSIGSDGLLYFYGEFTADSLKGDAPFTIFDSALYSYKDADCFIVKIGLDGKMIKMVTFGGNGEDIIWSDIKKNNSGFVVFCTLRDSFSLGNSYKWVGKYPNLKRTCIVEIDTNLDFRGISDVPDYCLVPVYFVLANNGDLICSYSFARVVPLNDKSYGNLNPKDSSKSDVIIVRSKPNFYYLSTKQIHTQNIDQTSFPNPASLETRLTYSLPSPSPVTITVHDMLGREMMRKELGMREAGSHEEQLDVSELPIGSYIVKISTNQETFTSRISVVR